ncbi:MAG: hypothetical protein K6357_05795 [Elusimicrobiota bacterium]
MIREKIKLYVIELIRLGILLITFYMLESFLTSLSFISELTIFSNKILFTEFLAFLFLSLSCYIIYEFSVRTRNIVNEMFPIIPDAGLIHCFIIYLIVIVLSYFAGIGIFRKVVEEDLWWSYNLVFIGFLIYYSAKIGLVVYKNSHTISSNIFETFKKF